MKWEGLIVEEVHDIRQQMMAEFDNDFHRLCEHLRAKKKEHPERYVTVEKLKAGRPAVAEVQAHYGATGPRSVANEHFGRRDTLYLLSFG